MTGETSVRALFTATTVAEAQPPYNTLHLKVFYPAQLTGSAKEQDLGIVPPDVTQTPFPVVIFFSGVNCGAELYQWLAVQLAERGLVVVLFNWVAENLPGVIGLTPGADVQAWAPGIYGTKPTASALAALLAALQRLQTDSLLAGTLDLNKVILGGHSAGGRVAIESANPQFFTQIAAAFAYGAHTAAPVQMGYDPNQVLPLPSAVPTLLIGGTRDGVIANSGQRYGLSPEQASHLIRRTFDESVAAGTHSYLLLLEGANHFAITDAFDQTTGRAFLDYPTTHSDTEIRSLIAEAIGLFIDAHVQQQAKAQDILKQWLETPPPFVDCFKQK
jgi:dienelactone hydrolase